MENPREVSLPLLGHPRVLTLNDLVQGVSLTDIQRKNGEWVEAGGEGYIPHNAKEWKHHFLIQRHDNDDPSLHFS